MLLFNSFLHSVINVSVTPAAISDKLPSYFQYKNEKIEDESGKVVSTGEKNKNRGVQRRGEERRVEEQRGEENGKMRKSSTVIYYNNTEFFYMGMTDTSRTLGYYFFSLSFFH